MAGCSRGSVVWEEKSGRGGAANARHFGGGRSAHHHGCLVHADHCLAMREVDRHRATAYGALFVLSGGLGKHLGLSLGIRSGGAIAVSSRAVKEPDAIPDHLG